MTKDIILSELDTLLVHDPNLYGNHVCYCLLKSLPRLSIEYGTIWNEDLSINNVEVLRPLKLECDHFSTTANGETSALALYRSLHKKKNGYVKSVISFFCNFEAQSAY